MSAHVITLHPDAETLGDWNAEAGSEAWCKALRLSLQNVVKSIATVPEKVRDYVERAVAHRAWVHWRDADGKPFRDFDAFCAAPLPHGLGRPFSEIRPYLEAVKGPVVTAALTASVAAAPSPPPAHVGPGRGKKNAADESKPRLSNHGNASSYLAARIAPEVAEKMKAGEYPSVRAAARAAGLVKDPDPVKVAARALKKVPAERMGEVVGALNGGAESELLIEALDRGWEGIIHALDFLNSTDEEEEVDCDRELLAFALQHLSEFAEWVKATSKQVDPWGDRRVALAARKSRGR
jgi:hypothetical protein